MNSRRSIVIMSFLVLCVFLLIKCIDIDKESHKTAVIKDSGWSKFAGSASCAGCHKKIYQSHLQTAHDHTSSPASQQSLMGNFETGKNIFLFNDGTEVVMEKRDSNFYQVEYIDGVKK